MEQSFSEYKNYPLIDIINRVLIKFDSEPSIFINYYYQYIDNNEIITKLKNKCKSILYDHINRNHYIFRNFKNNNILPSMLIYKNRTIFKNINPDNFDINLLIDILNNDLLQIKYFLIHAFNMDLEQNNNFDTLILNIKIMDDYDWAKKMRILINDILQHQ